jgi:hypothetical protein
MKILTQPSTGRTFRMGRTRPIARGPRFNLRNYLKQSLPAPPPTVNYAIPAAAPSLAEMYLNDQLGDCVIACMGHMQGVFTAGATGTAELFTNTQITSLYSAIGGYVPGNPNTDNGCNEQTALNYWQQTGLISGDNKITAWLAVNGHDATEVRTALWLFENLMFGFELPDAWINPFPSTSGFLWTKAGAPDPENGHCVYGYGYAEAGVQISTWGMTGTITFPAIKQYTSNRDGGELYTVLTEDAINKATDKAPSGFDFSQLLADLDSMSV